METKNEASSYTNLTPNVAGVLSYIITPLTGIFFFILEKKNKFVRFHAAQSVLFGITVFMLMRISRLFWLFGLGWIFREIVSVVAFVYYLILMWKAYNGEEYQLPYLGSIAKKQIRGKES